MRFGVPTDIVKYESVKGGFQALEPGVYLGVVKKLNPDYKSATKQTPAIEMILEAKEGTMQADGSSPAKRQITNRIWLPTDLDDDDKKATKYGQVRYFLEDCFGLNAAAGEFDTSDIEGRELVFRVKLGDVVTQGKHIGKRFTEVNYIRPVREWANEWASGPEKSEGMPLPINTGASAASVPTENTRYASSY